MKKLVKVIKNTLLWKRCIKNTKIKLQEERDTLKEVLDAVPELIFYKDIEGRYLGYNEAYRAFYKERGIENFIGKTDFEVLSDQKLAKDFCEIDQKVINEGRTIEMEAVFPDFEGNPRQTEYIKAPLLNQKGEIYGIVGLSRDITEKRETEDKLRYLSYTDILTGVFNRTYFEERLEALNKPQYLPLGIIMGDVNGLKSVNDTLGHLEGDKLLKRISSILEESCEGSGEIFRWGGDEFIILVPRADDNVCYEMINRITEKCKMDTKGRVPLSIALGVAIKKHVEEDSYQCLKTAEKQVYYEKVSPITRGQDNH